MTKAKFNSLNHKYWKILYGNMICFEWEGERYFIDYLNDWKIKAAQKGIKKSA